MKKIITGQSLFEVLFAITIAAVILIGLVALTTSSIGTSTASRNQSLAIKYSREAIEWLREEREVGWTTFAAYASETGSTWCLPNLSWANPGECGSTSADMISGTNLFREIVLTSDSDADPKVIQIELAIEWSDSKGVHIERTITRFTYWKSSYFATPVPEPPPMPECTCVCSGNVVTEDNCASCLIELFAGCIDDTTCICN